MSARLKIRDTPQLVMLIERAQKFAWQPSIALQCNRAQFIPSWDKLSDLLAHSNFINR